MHVGTAAVMMERGLQHTLRLWSDVFHVFVPYFTSTELPNTRWFVFSPPTPVNNGGCPPRNRRCSLSL